MKFLSNLSSLVAGSVLFIISVFVFYPSSASADTFYWYKTGVDSNWQTLTGNWWTDSDHTIQAGSLPGSFDDVITVGSTSPEIDLISWTEPASIVATSTGLSVTAIPTGEFGENLALYPTVTGDVVFHEHAVLGGTLDGNAIFNDYSRNYGVITDSHTVTFNDGTANVRPITGTITFNGSSHNWDDVSGTVVFNGNSLNDTGTVLGDATFNDSSQNQNHVTGTATFNGDSSENTRTDLTGTSVRRYTSNISTTRNFVTGGPWTVIADGAVVNIVGATYNGSTILTTLNGGSFVTPTSASSAGGCGTVYQKEGNTTYAISCGVKKVFSVDPVPVPVQPIQAPITTSAVGVSTSSGSLTVIATSTKIVFSAPVVQNIPVKKTHNFLQNLKQGDENSEVLELQNLLKSLGYLKVSPNGYFGFGTRAAVIVFQKANGLSQTGFFGPLSRKLASQVRY